MSDQRPHDIVLFGATGYTGRLTALYLAEHAPPECRWALAGRDRDKLARLRGELAERRPGLSALPLVVADAGDPVSMRAVAESARVVASTVGPYLEHGEPLVAACAAAGADYVDVTGEPEFVDRMYLAHHAEAVSTGSRLVHCAGFDSVPHDLGVLMTVRRLPRDAPIHVRGVVRGGGGFSGGTFHTGLEQAARLPRLARAASQRRRVEPEPEGRRARVVRPRPARDPATGLWLVPLPTIDPAIVVRSARALPEYGPDFSYAHLAGLRRLRTVAAGAGALALVTGVAQVPPLRRLLAARVPRGTGPDEQQRERSPFTVDFLGEGGGRRVRTRVSGQNPYTETATMLAESALSLALDDNPATSGQVTTAVAMGDRLTERLVRAGLRFEVVGEERVESGAHVADSREGAQGPGRTETASAPDVDPWGGAGA